MMRRIASSVLIPVRAMATPALAVRSKPRHPPVDRNPVEYYLAAMETPPPRKTVVYRDDPVYLRARRKISLPRPDGNLPAHF